MPTGRTSPSAQNYPGHVQRKYSFALRPGWLVLHLVTLAAVITMILLGRWQLHVSESKHFNIQNFGYTIQWWVFAGFTCFFWWRVMRDAAQRKINAGNPPPAETESPKEDAVAYRRYVMPTTPDPTDDPQITAYNEYLAQLAARDAAEKETQ